MARRRRQDDQPKGPSRKQILRERKAAEERQLLLTIFVPILVLVGVLLAWGSFRELYQKPRQPVAKVNDQTIQAEQFVPRLQYERYQLLNTLRQFEQFAQVQQGPDDFMSQYANQARDNLPQQTVDRLIDESLIEQEAEERGITVTAQEVTDRIYGELTNTPTPVSSPTAEVITSTAGITVTATVSPTVTRTEGQIALATREAERLYDQYIVQSILEVTGLTERQYREIVRSQILREKLQEALGEEIETTAKQVEAEHLVFTSAETAEQARQRLEEGATWEQVADEFAPPPTPTPLPTDEPTEDASGAVTGEEDEVEVPDAADAGSGDEEPSETDSGAETEDVETPSDTEATASATVTATETLTDTSGPGAGDVESDSSEDTGDVAPTDALTQTDSVTDTSAVTDTVGVTETDGVTDTLESAPTATLLPSPTPEPYASQVGERRWFSRDGLKERLGFSDSEATDVLALEPGQHSEILDGRSGSYLVRVFDVEESRELDEGELEARRASALDDWLQEVRTQATIDRYPVIGLVPDEPLWFQQEFTRYVQAPAAGTSPAIAVTTVPGNEAPPVEGDDDAPEGGTAP